MSSAIISIFTCSDFQIHGTRAGSTNVPPIFIIMCEERREKGSSGCLCQAGAGALIGRGRGEVDELLRWRMRRREREVSEAEARDILGRAEHGVLATVGEDGWPYAVPVNHVLRGNVLYIHCALEGHKLENLAHEGRVSYCAVASAKVVPELLSTFYESAVVFGRAVLVSDAEEKRKALTSLIDRFSVDEAKAAAALSNWSHKTAVIRIDIERITGKAHR